MEQEILEKLEVLQTSIKELSKQMDKTKIIEKKVFYEKSAIAADYGISEQTIRRHIRNGVLGGYKFGKFVYVKLDELQDRIEEGKIVVDVVRA